MSFLSGAIFKAAIYNSTIDNDTNFFDSDLVPANAPCTFQIYYVGTSAAGQGNFYPCLVRTNASDTVIEIIAHGLPFASGGPIIFNVIVAPQDSINFKIIPGAGTAGIVTMIVLEVAAPTGLASLSH
jgi:hypothetical protein